MARFASTTGSCPAPERADRRAGPCSPGAGPTSCLGDLLRYRVLGEVAAQDGPLGGPKPRSVLAALLLHANQVVPDRRLCELVWGDSPPATVRSQVQIYVSGLRKLLGPDAIRRQAGGYLVAVRSGELDLDLF